MSATELATPHTLPSEALDSALAQHPFGNSQYITEQLHTCYKRRLSKLSGHLASAGQLLDALGRTEPDGQYCVIGDTVVRCAVQHAHVQVETGTEYGLPLQQCDEIFRETLHLIEKGQYGPLGSQLHNRLGPNPYHGWIWSEERADDVFARSLRFIVQDNYGERLYTPNKEELAMLSEGTQLLSELLPLSSRSALSHAHLIAVFPQVGDWRGRMSSSEFRISGTFFLSRTLLSNPWMVAEHVFHESLHQQLYDFRQGHSLLDPNFIREGAPLIHSLWNRPDSSRGSYWDVHRALAAFHVYVLLALLCATADQHASELEKKYGPIMMVGRRTALARAHYLNEQIRALCWDELGDAGKRFMDWFTSVLETLDPSPPAQGAYIHLLLDRYWREAKEMESLLDGAEPHLELPDQLPAMIDDEVKIARLVLAELNEDLNKFNDTLASFSNEKSVTKFLSVRTLIAETILNASSASYVLAESRVPDQMVRQMVENSSKKLQTLLSR